MKNHLQKIYFCIFSVFLGWIFISPVNGAESDLFMNNEDTMLMFVGENLEVLTIASRREESAWKAPAVAQVITRKTLRERGADTISKALETVPGFYTARKEWGTRPYLRGIPDSMLLLYDTVPLTSDISKSLHPFDRELSMAAVKRIEIIKGPGSVLWGPDAFAGIVNIVPMTGKDIDGVETGFMYGSPGNQGGTYINMGHDSGRWDTFLSISGYTGKEDDTECNVVKFWGEGKEPVALDERYGSEKPDDSRYIEAVARLSYNDLITLSGRFTDNRRSYAMSSEAGFTWEETRENPISFIKIEAKKAIDHLSVLRMTGLFSQMETEQLIIDRELNQREREVYGEIIYDRSFWSGGGLFTGGFSYREKYIKDAPVWDGYLPGFLQPENLYSLPIITEIDYDTRLWSLFSQYSHKLGDAEIWLGLRSDNHDSYKDRISFTAGVSWSPFSEWIIKSLYGTAYRTPFARQLRADENPELENIKSANLQIGWEPSWKYSISACGFWSRIEEHLMEDPYSGLSMPNHQEFTGLEVQGHYSPFRSLDFGLNFTLLNNKGPDEKYMMLKETTIDLSSGDIIKTYENRTYPYDTGPDKLLNFMVNWKPVQGFSSYMNLSYNGSRQLIHPRGDSFLSSPGIWLLDMTSIFRDVMIPGMELELSIRNLADHSYETPGTYNTINGEPFTVQAVIRKSW